MAEQPASVQSRLTDALARIQRSRWTRRGLLLAGAGAAAWWRFGGYPDTAARNLADWEVEVLAAAGRALLPPAPLEGFADTLGDRVGRYLTTMPSALRLEVHALLLAVEQGTVVGLSPFRFTRLEADQARRFLEGLEARGGYPRLIYRSLRDLVYLAYYQQDAAWPALDYAGPLVPPGVRGDAYISLRAPDGAVPPGYKA